MISIIISFWQAHKTTAAPFATPQWCIKIINLINIYIHTHTYKHIDWHSFLGNYSHFIVLYVLNGSQSWKRPISSPSLPVWEKQWLDRDRDSERDTREREGECALNLSMPDLRTERCLSLSQAHLTSAVSYVDKLASVLEWYMDIGWLEADIS